MTDEQIKAYEDWVKNPPKLYCKKWNEGQIPRRNEDISLYCKTQCEACRVFIEEYKSNKNSTL